MRKVTMQAIAILNKGHAESSNSLYWFEPAVMRFFQTEIESTALYQGEYFIASSCGASNACQGDPRRYTVQQVNPLDYSVRTLIPVQGFKTLEIANDFMFLYHLAGTDESARRFISALPKEVRLNCPSLDELTRAARAIESDSELHRHLIRHTDIALAHCILKHDPLSLYNRDNDY